MRKIYINRKLFTLHSWLGLFLGVFYFLIAISGAVSVFRFELNNLIYGRKMTFGKEVSGTRISYDSIYKIAKREFPGMPYYVCGFDDVYPDRPAFYSGGDHVSPRLFSGSMQYRINYLNPYTGREMLQTNGKGKNNMVDWIMAFHYSFMMGEGGELFAVLVDMALLISIITGFIFYRKYIGSVLTFKVKIRFTNWRMASSGLHRVIGTWALMFNLLIFLSGLYIQRKFFIEKWWEKYSHSTENMHMHSLSFPLSNVSLDSLKIIALQKMPNMHFQGFGIDGGHGGDISAFGLHQESIFQAYDNYVAVNFDRAGKFTSITYTPWKDYQAMDKWADINFSLFHTGWALGIPGKIIWCIMGLSPAFLSLTGFLLWWRKKGGKKIPNKRQLIPKPILENSESQNYIL